MSIALWHEIEQLKRHVQELRERTEQPTSDQIQELSERMAKIEQWIASRPGRKPKT